MTGSCINIVIEYYKIKLILYGVCNKNIILIPLLSNFPGCKSVSSKTKCVLFDNCNNPFKSLLEV